MKYRILHLLNTSSYSGAENVAISIINNMGDNVECAYASLNGSIRDDLEKNNIKFLPMNSMTLFEIRRIVYLFKPDIIHAHDYTTSIVAAFSHTKVPIISHLHNNSPWIKTYHPYSFIYLLSTLKFKKVLGVSDSIFQEYVFGKEIEKKSLVVSNPVDINKIKFKAKIPVSNNISYDLVFLGRLAMPKNPLRFIELVKKISIRYPTLRVALIGEGNLKTECQNKIVELELTEHIEMLGFVSNPYPIVANAKVLCMTSKWEGFGLVAIEALSLGVPVVAPPVGGIRDIVDDDCGLLTNNDEIYIDETIKLLENKSYWNNKSQKAVEKSRKFNNLNKYIENLKYIYSFKY